MKYCKILFIVLFTFLRSELISPENNELLKTIHVWFEWKQEPDASQYNLQISRDPLFSNLVQDIDFQSNCLTFNTV